VTHSGSQISLIPYDEAYGEGFEDMYRRVPDTTKVRELLDWRPTRTLEDVVQDVVACQRGIPTLAPAALGESGADS
jgi:UDP-glucose 4-epimerase